jgi:hypothetical protein
MTKFGQKFCSKHPLKQEGDIVNIPQEQIDSAKLGASGNLGLIGGTVSKAAGAFINTAKQYAQKAGWLKKSSNFKPLITGNKVYDKQSINNAFASRFNTSSTPTNVIKTATEKKDALTHLKNVKKMASNVGPKNTAQALTSSTRRTNFTSGR